MLPGRLDTHSSSRQDINTNRLLMEAADHEHSKLRKRSVHFDRRLIQSDHLLRITISLQNQAHAVPIRELESSARNRIARPPTNCQPEVFQHDTLLYDTSHLFPASHRICFKRPITHHINLLQTHSKCISTTSSSASWHSAP